MIRQYDFAPLDGITKTVFRRVWNDQFGGADRFFIPFFSPTSEHVMTSRDLKELDRARNAGLELVPQVMTKRAEDFLWATEIVKDLGYTEANLNLGCPSGTVAGKGKGSGFLSKPDELEKFFDEVFSKVTFPRAFTRSWSMTPLPPMPSSTQNTAMFSPPTKPWPAPALS